MTKIVDKNGREALRGKNILIRFYGKLSAVSDQP
jgi:hypothetical protein